MRAHPSRSPILALLSAALVSASGAQVQRVHSVSRDYSLELPYAWTFRSLEPRDPEHLIALEGTFPGTVGRVEVDLYTAPAMRHPLAQAYHESRWRPDHFETVRAEVFPGSAPRLELEFQREGERWISVYFHRLLDGRGVMLQCTCPEIVYAVQRDALSRVAASIRTELGPWPPPIPGFETASRAGISYLLHPSTKPHLDQVEGIVREARTRFVAMHGNRPATLPSRIEIVLVPSKERLAAMGRAQGTQGVSHVREEERLYAVPPNGIDARASFCENLAMLLLQERYGMLVDHWVHYAEATAAWMASRTGDAAEVPKTFFSKIPNEVERLDRLPPLAKTDWSGYCSQAYCYAAFFRSTDTKAKTAYRDFLEEYGRTYDVLGAEKKHLLTLDLDALRDEVNAFIPSRLKSSSK